MLMIPQAFIIRALSLPCFDGWILCGHSLIWLVAEWSSGSRLFLLFESFTAYRLLQAIIGDCVPSDAGGGGGGGTCR